MQEKVRHEFWGFLKIVSQISLWSAPNHDLNFRAKQNHSPIGSGLQFGQTINLFLTDSKISLHIFFELRPIQRAIITLTIK